MNEKILVVGGAGYIGSHCVLQLSKEGFFPVVVDNLSRGHADAVLAGEFIKADLGHTDELRAVFKKHDIKGVMHFAAFAYVGESMEQPDKYYINNVSNMINLLNVMKEFDIKNIVFSSSCAVYGNPSSIPITEEHVQNPLSPYGRSKQMCEYIIKDYSHAFGFKYILFRYFNAAGANPNALIGERHDPETHLIPLALKTALGQYPHVKIFGVDYDTPDGTCIRDYIHVDDLSDAHIRGYKFLTSISENQAFNLGCGNGYSVREVIEMCREVSGCEIHTLETKRRPGDPPKLVSSSKKANEVLGWEIKHASLKEIIQTAWRWHRKEPK